MGANTARGEFPAEASAHKLFAPPTYSGAIRRDAILQRVFQRSDVRVFLLQAPAGHGKSTTLQQIKSACEASGCLTAWLTFDDADNDMGRFAIHIQALVAQLDSAGRDKPDNEIGVAHGKRRSDWMLDRLMRLRRPVAVFLDEFQTLRNRPVLNFFRDLFDRVPENVRMVIGSRSLPEVGLAKLLVNNVALVLRADDLRFTHSEVSQFFAATGDLQISGAEIDTIYRHTEGWPAALQLYRLTLASSEVRNSLGDLARHSPRELAEYLSENVLALQSPRTQDFLLRTSLLTRLTAPLCDAVTGRRDSQDMLLQLERSGLFLRSLDPDCRWFRYHGLFSTILAENLSKTSEAAAFEVHARAAKWHLSQDLYEETVFHALACRDFTLAADTLSTWASKLIASGHLVTVERWYDRLPFENVAKRPDLAIKIAYALMFLRRHQKLQPVLELLRRRKAAGESGGKANPDLVLAMAAVMGDDIPGAFRAVDRMQLRDGEDVGFPAFERGAAANVLAYGGIATGDFEGARKSLALARSCNDRGAAAFSGGYTVAITGINLIVQGHLREALDRFGKEMAEQRAQLDKSLAAAAQASCYIWALYEANELDLVESQWGQYHDDISESVILDCIAIAHLSMSRAHDARGRPDKAVEVLDEIEQIAGESGWGRLSRLVDWERVRRALAAGAIDRAQVIAAHIAPLRTQPPDDWIPLSDDIEGEALGRIRLAIHSLDPDTAARTLALEMTRQRGRTYRQMKLYLLDALLKQRKGAHNAAHRSLRRALELAKPGRFVRSFLDEGDGVIQLLREEYQNILGGATREGADFSGNRAFVEQLLAASGTDLSRAPAKAGPQLMEPLSDREREILALLADGVSNQEMANRLFVSENTVKFHLKNIFSKLAVGNRLQAINTARELRLVR